MTRMNLIEDCEAQWQAVGEFFDALGATMDRMPVLPEAAAGSAHNNQAHNTQEGELA